MKITQKYSKHLFIVFIIIKNRKLSRRQGSPTSAAMASATWFRTIFLTKPWRPLPRNRASPSVSFFSTRKPENPHLGCGCKLFKARNHCLFTRRTQHLNYSDNEAPSSSPDDSEPNPPQEAVLKAISGLFDYNLEYPQFLFQFVFCSL